MRVSVWSWTSHVWLKIHEYSWVVETKAGVNVEMINVDKNFFLVADTGFLEYMYLSSNSQYSWLWPKTLEKYTAEVIAAVKIQRDKNTPPPEPVFQEEKAFYRPLFVSIINRNNI